MDRSQPSPGLSPTLQIALITAVAATLGIVAGGALVYLQQRRDSGDDLLGSRRRSKASRSSSVNNAVPLFDSVQVGLSACVSWCALPPCNSVDLAKNHRAARTFLR